jgi:hypothetical protein
MTVGASGTPASAGLPVIDQLLEPAWIRNGSAATQKAYALAQGFEEMLVQELVQPIAATNGISGEGTAETGEAPQAGTQAAGTSPLSNELSSLVPQALSGGVMKAGGLGLAAQLTREMEAPEAVQHVSTGGGTEA